MSSVPRYRIGKIYRFEAARRLTGCPGGHGFRAEIVLASDHLVGPGFVVDFGELAPVKRYIDAALDHRVLDEVLDEDPTDETIAWHGIALAPCLVERRKLHATDPQPGSAEIEHDGYGAVPHAGHIPVELVQGAGDRLDARPPEQAGVVDDPADGDRWLTDYRSRWSRHAVLAAHRLGQAPQATNRAGAFLRGRGALGDDFLNGHDVGVQVADECLDLLESLLLSRSLRAIEVQGIDRNNFQHHDDLSLTDTGALGLGEPIAPRTTVVSTTN